MIELILILAATFLFYNWWSIRKPKGFPPGPPYIPILGSIPFVPLPNLHFYLEKARKKYGPIIGMKLASADAVAFCGAKEVQEALKTDDLQGRPNISVASTKAVKGIILTEGQFWATQRRFTLRHLRDFGFGKRSTEGLILDEIDEFFKAKLTDTTQVQVGHLFNNSAVNILWALMAGTRFGHDDKEFKFLLEVIEKTFRAGGFTNRFVFMRRFFRKIIGWEEKPESEDLLYAFVQKTIEEHKKTMTETPRDFIDAYLMEIAREDNPDFNEVTLISICLDLFSAGAESIGNTISFCIMYMVLYPELQKELHEEIDRVIGKNRISLEDKPRLPKLEAFYSEVARINTIAPIVIPRRAMADVNFKGYNIPKGTFVIISLWALFRDKEHWGDPENFRPSRFLNENGEFVKDEYLTHFGIGKRACPGESLARFVLFLFLTSLIQSFEFKIPEGHAKPSTEGLPGFTSAPKSFEVVLTRRA